MSVSVVILAAGQGVRMKSTLPKVLQPLGGMPMLKRIVATVTELDPSQIIIVHGHQSELLRETFKSFHNITWAEQLQQQGTGHAVLQALPKIGDVEKVLIVFGDVPLLTSDTLKSLVEESKKFTIGFVTQVTDANKGLGRIIRNAEGNVLEVVEEKDASVTQKEIKEINAGIFLVDKKRLKDWLPKLSMMNAQHEYYLPEIIKFAVKENLPITTVSPKAEHEILGVNDKTELARLERIFQRQQAEQLMKQGVTLFDPARFDLRGHLKVGEDVVIDVNAIFEGEVKLGNGVSIGPNVIIKHSEIHDGVQILANSIIEGAVISAGCVVGPFARIRPGTELNVNARVGNFVEVKNAIVGPQSKINHLSYIGDAHLGQDVNIGAGTITCNYDGKSKHQTTIGNHVFIGSDTQLVAPVKVGDRATIGAGTTVVKDVLPNQLVHNKIEQRTVSNWARKDSSE